MAWLEARCDLPELRGRLMRNEVGAFYIDGTQAALVLSVGTARDSGQQGLWIESLGGSVGSAHQKNKALLRSVLMDCETLARASNCMEIRIEEGTRTQLKKRLFVAFGFEPLDVSGATVMRKAL